MTLDEDRTPWLPRPCHQPRCAPASQRLCHRQGVHHWTIPVSSPSRIQFKFGVRRAWLQRRGHPRHRLAATHQRVPTDLSEKSGNIRKIFIGTIASTAGNTDKTIQLTADIPDLGDYTLEPGSYVWIESPTTADYRQTLGTQTGTDTIVVTAAVETDSVDGNAAPGSAIPGTTQTYPGIANRRVYIRRLIDTRTQESGATPCCSTLWPQLVCPT